MNICFVTPYSPREVTGVSKFVDDLCRTLEKRNIDSFVITRLACPEIKISMKMIEINCNIFPISKDLYLSIRTTIEIFKMRKKINLLHLQTPLPQSAFAAIIGRILRIPVVTTIHGRFPPSKNPAKMFFYYFMEKITFIFSNKLVLVSEDTKKHFNVSNGIVILNGVDTDYFSPNCSARNKKRKELGIGDEIVYIYVGRWVAHKGIYDLLDTFSQIILKIDKKPKLIFVGTGESSKVLNRIEKLKIGENVLPIGKVDNVQEYLSLSDAFVLFTSPLEGLPLALLEAMSCGVVPIASDISSIPEVITNGKNGFLVKYLNQFDLFDKMIWCINNKEKLSLIGENATKVIKEHYSLDKMTDKYVNIYNLIIEK